MQAGKTLDRLEYYPCFEYEAPYTHTFLWLFILTLSWDGMHSGRNLAVILPLVLSRETSDEYLHKVSPSGAMLSPNATYYYNKLTTASIITCYKYVYNLGRVYT